MNTIVLWNDENKRYEKWVIKRDNIEINTLGGELNGYRKVNKRAKENPRGN